MDRIELSSGTELKLADLGGATVIKLTGNWTNLGTPSALTLTKAVDKVSAIDVSEATGIVSAAFNEAKTELVVSCKNTPIAVTPTTLKLHPGESSTIKAMTYAAGETVSWKSSDTTVATVDGNGKVTAHKAGIAVISDTGSVSRTTAGCTVTVEDPASPDPVPTPAPITPTVVTEKDNPVKTDKNVPADVKPATPVITPATEENTIALAASADVPVKFFTATADGNITVDHVTAKKAVASVMSDDVAVAPKTIMTLPVIAAAIDSGKVAALAMKTTGAQLGAAANNVVSDITLIKILKDGTGAKFGYTAEPAGYADQSFTLKNADGNNLAFTDKIDPTATYTLILFVKDNGEFDYDKTMGSVIDPVAMAMNEAKAPKPSGGSSSGCSAGVGVLALLALLPLAAARRKR
ncbi:MAG: SYNERG-CTERM sorting domain-containing protein [Synergistaceae bacterium]|nr:SYNERG-CTERM sorting domain-containing protein [Synergistaceae bacterium]